METTIERLPSLLFVENRDDVKLALTFERGVDSARDMFLLLVDLMSKGIVLLFGNGGSSVSLNTLSGEDVGLIARKFMNAGVRMAVETEPLSDAELAAGFKPHVGFETVPGVDPGRLEAYRMLIVESGRRIAVAFSLQPPGEAAS